jgi:peptidoglycan/xylan/chitin deacetylase (PgdA/CDA1 family)
VRRGRRWLRRLAAVPASLRNPNFLAVFNYHQVSPDFDPLRQHRWTWTPLAHFERQMRAIARHFRVLPLAAALEQIRAGTLRGRCAAITLDDGDLSLERWTIPLLRRLKMPATLFVNSGYWDSQPVEWARIANYLANHPDPARRQALPEAHAELRNTSDPIRYREVRARVEALAPLIDAAERFVVRREFLASLEPELFAAGLHGREHQRFSMMSTDWQRDCLDDDLAALRELRGFVPLFAVPFGRPHDWDDTAATLAAERGLHLVLADGGFTRNGDRHCSRIPADGADAIELTRRTLVGW